MCASHDAHMNTPNETILVPAPLHIALVTETYLPEVNGVAITIGRMVHGLAPARAPHPHDTAAPVQAGYGGEGRRL